MSTEKPHILLITLDELQRAALGCYGNEAVATPNIDRLAAEGLRFDNAYTTSPVCLPARCSILTGLYPHNSRAYSNFRECPLNPELPNLYTCLKDAGYYTAHIGKCHFAPAGYGAIRADASVRNEAAIAHYHSLGMDHLDLQDDKNGSVWFRDDYTEALDEAGLLEVYRDAVWDRQGNRNVFTFPGPTDMHPDAWVGNKAKAFLEDWRTGKPLFMWLSFSGPHWPFDPPAEYLERVDVSKIQPIQYADDEFEDPTRMHYTSFHGPIGLDACPFAPDQACKNFTSEYWTTLRQHYYANLALIDDKIGEVLDSFTARLGQNVLVIFTTDHGELLGNHRLWGKNFCGYDDVMRVPLFVQNMGTENLGLTPGVRGAGGVCPSNSHDENVGTVPPPLEPRSAGDRPELSHPINIIATLNDVFPTCLAAAQVECPPCDGQSLLTGLAGVSRDYAVSEMDGFLAITNGRRKYVQFRYEDRAWYELFDLETDPGEYHNCIGDGQYASDLAQLRGGLLDFLVQDVLP